MIKDVLDYTWVRSQVLNAIMDLPHDTYSFERGDAILSRAEDLSRSIVECVSGDTFVLLNRDWRVRPAQSPGGLL